MINKVYSNVEPTKIMITGHSLGGSLAQIFALDLKLNPISGMDIEAIQVITFGTPRTRDEKFKISFDGIVQ